jgi:uncharacterized protein YcbX
MTRVARISVTPVKGFRLSHPEEVRLGREGVAENRRFFLVDSDGQRLRSSQTPWPTRVQAEYLADSELLRLRFPDGTDVEASAFAGEEQVHSTAGTIHVAGRIVEGPWEAPLERLAGQPVRLARADRVGAGMLAPVTLVSDGSLARLAQEARRADVDARRFRMLFQLDGCAPHEEDTWEGLLFQIGTAVVRVGGPVERCAVTTRDPETGERDLDTLRLVRDYRGGRDCDGAVLFGVYATVEQPGVVRVGDDFARVA